MLLKNYFINLIKLNNLSKGKAHSLCIDTSGSLYTWGAGKNLKNF
jgi:alpha-tubulin suppressor-like RCC1 family protein